MKTHNDAVEIAHIRRRAGEDKEATEARAIEQLPNRISPATWT